jgi:hypothetical protein
MDSYGAAGAPAGLAGADGFRLDRTPRRLEGDPEAGQQVAHPALFAHRAQEQVPRADDHAGRNVRLLIGTHDHAASEAPDRIGQLRVPGVQASADGDWGSSVYIAPHMPQ